MSTGSYVPTLSFFVFLFFFYHKDPPFRVTHCHINKGLYKKPFCIIQKYFSLDNSEPALQPLPIVSSEATKPRSSPTKLNLLPSKQPYFSVSIFVDGIITFSLAPNRIFCHLWLLSPIQVLKSGRSIWNITHFQPPSVCLHSFFYSPGFIHLLPRLNILIRFPSFLSPFTFNPNKTPTHSHSLGRVLFLKYECDIDILLLKTLD